MTTQCTDIFIDYITMTWHPTDISLEDTDLIHAFFDMFPQFHDLMDSEIKGGRYFYDECMVFSDNIRLWYCKPESTNYLKMGVCLEVPSHGLDWLFDKLELDKHSLVSLFNWAFDNDFKVSRLDLTYDDYSRRFLPSFYELFWTLHPDHIKTHFRTKGKAGFNTLDEDLRVAAPFFLCTGAKMCGQTFYLGNRSSGKMMRIYDKYYESGCDESKNCIRYEFELHRKHCEWLINFLIENNGLNFKELITSFFKLLDYNSNDSNKSRNSLLPEWEEWLDQVVSEAKHNFNEVLRVPKYSPQELLDRKFQWIQSCKYVIAGLRYFYGDDFDQAMDVDVGEIPKKYKDLKWKKDLLCS